MNLVSEAKLSDRHHFDFSSVSIIPTYARDFVLGDSKSVFAEEFPNEMSIESLDWLLDRLRSTSEVETIIFGGSGGGEPTSWSQIDTAIFRARKKGFRVGIITDALASLKKSLPDFATIHFSKYLTQPEYQAKAEETIDFYTENKVPVRVNFFTKNSESLPPKILQDWSEKFAIDLAVRPAYQHQDLDCRNCIYKRFVIQPDGDTLSICRFLLLTAKFSDYLSLSEVYENVFWPDLKKTPACLARA